MSAPHTCPGTAFNISAAVTSPLHAGTVTALKCLLESTEGDETMAKSARPKSAGTRSSRSSSGNDNVDKLAKAAMSKEMLAAGLAAAAAAISASPKARRAIRDAGLDAADSASAAATNVMASATKLGSIIAEAVADAAQRVLSGKWTEEGTPARASAGGGR